MSQTMTDPQDTALFGLLSHPDMVIVLIAFFQTPDKPLTAQRIADRTGLSLRGATITIDSLVEAGVVERHDRGNGVTPDAFSLRKDEPGIDPLRAAYEKYE